MELKESIRKNKLIIVPFVIAFIIFITYDIFGNFNLVKDVYKIFKISGKSFEYRLEQMSFDSSQKSNSTAKVDTFLYEYSLDISSTDISDITIEGYGDENISYDVCFYHKNIQINCIKRNNAYLSNGNKQYFLALNRNVDNIKITISEDRKTKKLTSCPTLVIDNIKINENKNVFYKVSVKKFFKEIILFSLLIVISILFLKKLKRIDININKFFVITALILGITSSILVPIYQTPDEESHIEMIYKSLNSYDKSNVLLNDNMDTKRIIMNSSEKVDFDKYMNFNDKFTLNMKGLPNIRIIKHFPQIIAILICALFKCSTFTTFFVGELFALLFYIFICNKAIKLIPYKKTLFMSLCLLPMCIQQMASFSYDAVLIPLCFLFIAYIFNLKFEKEKITSKDLIKLVLLISLISYIKLPYLILFLMIFILPFNKLDIKILNEYKNIKNKKHKKIISIIAVLVFILLILGGVYVLSKMKYGKIILAVFVRPNAYRRLITRSFNIHYKEYISGIVGNFGWLETAVAWKFGLLVIIFIIIFSLLNFHMDKQNNDYKFKLYDRLFLIFIFLFGSIFIIYSLYEWTLEISGVSTANFSIRDYADYFDRLSTGIGGVQGRYFIPFLPLLFMSISNNKRNRHNDLYIFVYYALLFLYISFVLLTRYWI